MNILTGDVQKDNYDVSNLDSNMLIRENKGKIQERIEQFNIKYVNAIRRLKDTNPDYDLEYYEYKVAELSFNVDKLLVIKSPNVLRQVLASISMSDLLLDEGIENNDLECLMTAFSTLRYDLDNLNIFKEWFTLGINFESNVGIIKSKEDMFNDMYMNRLVDLIVEDDYSFLLPFIKGFFYITSENRYEKQYNLLKIRFPTEHSKCSMIYDIFLNWKPFEYYNMGECRGTFLELLTFKLEW